MKMLLKKYYILLAIFALCACGEEEYVYPDLVTEMVCLETDKEGFGIRFTNDEGKVWHLRKGNRPNKLTADSTYRMVFRYEPGVDAEATLYSLQPVIAPIPRPKHQYESIITDPLSIQSIWRSGDYLNMVLLPMVKDKEHEYAFIENDIHTYENGVKTLSIILFHDRKGDTEAFQRKKYLSVPLWPYESKLSKGDTLSIQLNTYEEGMTTRTYIY